jgi:uncharacterized protein (DUF488 family)
MIVSTLGCQGLGIDGFVSLLTAHDIETVVDIRELPLSRKPGFSKRALANTLKLAGFEYVHMVELGCPKPVRDRYRTDGDWKRYTKGFLKYLATQEQAIAKLSKLVSKSKCALLCYEADFNFCHRSMVANALHDYGGVRVRHIETAKAKTARAADSRQAFD